MRSTLSIKTRLSLAIGLTAAALAAASGLAGWTVRAIGSDARRIAEQDSRTVDVSAEIAGEVADLGRWERAHTLQRAQARDGAEELQQWDATYSRAAGR